MINLKFHRQSYEKSRGKRKEFILFFSRDGVTSLIHLQSYNKNKTKQNKT